jgi:hypothetical protein
VFTIKLRDFRFITIQLFYQVATSLPQLLARLTLLFLLKNRLVLGLFSITLSCSGSYAPHKK